MDENARSLLSRCIESAEFHCTAEEWKGYIISCVDGEFRFCALTNKKRREHAEKQDVIVIVRAR